MSSIIACDSTHIRTRCAVCGFSEIQTDEVENRGLLLLAECPRCDHRWTSRDRGDVTLRVGRPAVVRAPLRVIEEAASAA
jgi:hypothetical protein